MPTHKTFFGKIFGSAWDFAKDLFSKANDEFLAAAILITQEIKKIIDSDVVNIFTDIIPGDIDNKIVDALRNVLPKVISTELLLANIESDSTEEEIKAILEKIASGFGVLPEDKRGQFFTSLTAKIYIILEDGKVSFGEAALFAEAAYQEWLKSKEQP